MDLVAYNNEFFQVSFDVSAWSAAYELDGAQWRMQVRGEASSALVTMDLKTSNGRASYSSGVVVFFCPQDVVKAITGKKEWDFGFTPSSGDFIRCGGGFITFNQGVTR